jgi:hypothetical protein
MKKLLFAAVAALTTPAHAGGCDEATIRGVARGGSVVVLESGGIYKVERKVFRTRRFGTPETASWCAATRK